ncbi:DUF5518 domain-containing protein [Halorussus salinus]|uniref:DUF5518 domain-containing protein n=1 Tax=Halorussus salinus TaxID=1364935 RepID=UPI0010922D9A|nr:DUF5518 domain-containing protein [Halorussus salinus]
MAEISVPFRGTSDTWSYALAGGGISLLLGTVSYWQTGVELALLPILVGGVVAGYLQQRRLGERDNAGFVAGVLGALPVLWVVYGVVTTAFGLSNPLWFSVVFVSMAVGATVVVLGLSGCIGSVGARLGGRLAA